MIRIALLIALLGGAILVHIGWMHKIPVLTHPFFAHAGYGMHAVGGIGVMALVALVTQPVLRTAAATVILVLARVEFLQIDSPTRNFQVEDIIAQTLGVLVVYSLMQLVERGK